ncbi:MAG: hypothetical protein U1E10_19150, partial [Bdellovibrionales bacterium]|nr:hypothetical protein [Bdellovibrionales bacterium]
MLVRLFISLVGALLVGNSLALSVASAAGVLTATPTGSVKSVQQFLVKYSTDMIPMGDPRAKDPMSPVCTGNKSPEANQASGQSSGGAKLDIPSGKGRWVDSKTWSYDFDKPLGSGIRCTFTQNAAKDLAGEAIPTGTTYVFTTG